ncbi:MULTISPECIES: adenosylcobyric acid synthase [unclassified Granulicatella]|jgi:adenosylcobyric acid synthase (glutamine-hydrolyzing)|uniref:type 1 glutamine amidotransferase n=1 Tax=unclassified Granulicatella TaxID=2630493 RepID=UPI0025561C3D|nr:MULTISPECIES: adenosylcobyric acid synthase [unclassified Granulicatella]MDK8381622.1 adenosylcobyric acid synthase [Granulicatella sp. UMB5615B]MDK8522362.1 adenosylcobyric acid synthase [Granulicatella sp. UMB5615A]
MKLRICHLYGNLMNTYGDNGNLLMLQHRAKKLGYEVETTLISLEEDFNPDDFDIVMFGGGQDYEQTVVAKDLQNKKDALIQYIEDDGVVVAICGGFQLLGRYYVNASGERLNGISAIDVCTNGQFPNRLIGDVEIVNEEFGETYLGYENHIGRTYLGKNMKPLGKVVKGYGNNEEDHVEGCHYKNVFCSYFHGPILVRNQHLADRIIETAAERQRSKNA